MQLHEITTHKKNKNKTARRVGRGGRRGKTSGRGMKGQKARAGHKIRPEMRDFIKKIPKLRGYGINRARTVNSSKKRAVTVNVSVLNDVFENGDTVNIDSLIEKKVVSLQKGRKPLVKILAKGDLDKKLTVENLQISQKAKEIVEKAGGSVK